MKITVVFLLLAVGPSVGEQKKDTQSTTPKNPELRDELLRRRDEDQTARSVMITFMKKYDASGVLNPDSFTDEQKAEFEKVKTQLEKVDTENTAWMKKVVEKHGWPTKELVGPAGAGAAWLLVQHADRNPKFQRKCLDLMEKLPQGSIPAQNFAYLTDRVLLAEGKKQKYGTQFLVKDGRLVPSPMEPREEVERRRAEIGLPTLEEDLKMAEKMYGISQDPGKKNGK